ncbi:TPA: hypothetical protein ACN1LU_005251, partial [Klebsiella pneumoniae]
IDVNHDIEHVTEQCRQAVLAFRNVPLLSCQACL